MKTKMKTATEMGIENREAELYARINNGLKKLDKMRKDVSYLHYEMGYELDPEMILQKLDDILKDFIFLKRK